MEIVTPGWQPHPWGDNYFAASFANAFLSRKAFLGAGPSGPETRARREFVVPKTGRYLVLSRYEAPFRHEARFTVRVSQSGAVKLQHTYGRRFSEKVFPLGVRLAREAGEVASESIVWEGHDVFCDLSEGTAEVLLMAGEQEGNAARRNVDAILLTTDEADVSRRIEKEAYLPLDGLLTQAGDLFARIRVPPDGARTVVTIPPGIEHSPYWVHQRTWAPLEISAFPGETTDFVEVGSLLDTLNDGQWRISARAEGAPEKVAWSIDFAVPGPDGTRTVIATFDARSGALPLVYDADTRRTRAVHDQGEGLRQIAAALAVPARGKPPARTLVFGMTFDPFVDPALEKLRLDAVSRMGATAFLSNGLWEVDASDPPPPLRKGYVDVRGPGTAAALADLQRRGKADRVAVISLGDEIDLEKPPADAHALFRAWLQGHHPTPGDVDPSLRSWKDARYSPSETMKDRAPGLYHASRRFEFAHGIDALARSTTALQRLAPRAFVGANYSPHPERYLGRTHKWVSVFRRGAMTMPWSEDYAYSFPVGSQQMNAIDVDLFRAGLRHHPDWPIHMYVMPHVPGNHPDSFRRLFYSDLAHGTRIFNLFDFRPAVHSYTENYVNGTEMYLTVRTALHELGTFEDVIQEGTVQPAKVGLFFSETGDAWEDDTPPFGAGKRSLWLLLKHRELPLDIIVEEDLEDGTLSSYEVLYLTDRHVSRAATRKLAEWVSRGGTLVATAGAGLRDERDQLNRPMMELLGIEETELSIEHEPVDLEKRDLPWATPVGTVSTAEKTFPIFSARSRVRAVTSSVEARLEDLAPAATRRDVGKGHAVYLSFLPGLSYLRPALPRVPVDRNSRLDSMSHWLPETVDATAGDLAASPCARVKRPVSASVPFVESSVIRSPSAIVIPLVSWSRSARRGVRVDVGIPLEGRRAELASGGKLSELPLAGGRSFVLDLDVADAIVLR
jgi:hypothetical protein